MEDKDIFNTPEEEVKRLISEFRETKETLRELGGKLSRIETRLKRVFPSFSPKQKARTNATESVTQSMTPAEALTLYEELVNESRKGNGAKVHERLSALGLENLSLMRRELGVPLRNKKPSTKSLVAAISGRINESLMLSHHTNRQQLLDESTPQQEPANSKEDKDS